MDGNFLGGALILADAIEMIQPVDSTQMQNKIELIRHRGHAFRFSYLFEDAERLYLKALSMSKKGSSIYGKLLSNLAETRCWYNFEQAINDSNLALEENSKLNNLIEIGKNHTSLAIALCGLGKFEKSIEHLTEAERIFDSVGYLSGKLFVTIPKFIIAVKKGLEHESAQVYNEARLIVRQLKTYDHLLILYSKIIEDSKTFNQIFKQTSWLNVKRAKKTLIQIIHKFSLDNIGKA
jgi:tetratricopeptide (TPR) repeat protein